MAFQDKVLSVLIRLKSRVDALTRHLETWDAQMWQDLAIYKITREVSRPKGKAL